MNDEQKKNWKFTVMVENQAIWSTDGQLNWDTLRTEEYKYDDEGNLTHWRNAHPHPGEWQEVK